MGNGDTFVRITNQMIYEAIQKQSERLEVIELRIGEINGKVKKSAWMATTALTLVLIIIGLLFNHISR